MGGEVSAKMARSISNDAMMQGVFEAILESAQRGETSCVFNTLGNAQVLNLERLGYEVENNLGRSVVRW